MALLELRQSASVYLVALDFENYRRYDVNSQALIPIGSPIRIDCKPTNLAEVLEVSEGFKSLEMHVDGEKILPNMYLNLASGRERTGAIKIDGGYYVKVLRPEVVATMFVQSYFCDPVNLRFSDDIAYERDPIRTKADFDMS